MPGLPVCPKCRNLIYYSIAKHLWACEECGLETSNPPIYDEGLITGGNADELRLSEIYADPATIPKVSVERMIKSWPQAAGELAGFANALDRKGQTITAEQIRMAVCMADELYRQKASAA